MYRNLISVCHQRLLIYADNIPHVQKRSRADSSDNIYTETAFGLDSDDLLPHFDSKRSIRSSSVDTTLTVDTSHSVAKDSVSSEAPLLGPHHYYHELESNSSPRPLPRLPEPEGNSSPRPLPRLPGPESEGKSSPRPLPRLPPAITVDGETRGSLTNSLVSTTQRQTFLMMLLKANCMSIRHTYMILILISQENSTGGHHLYEPGIYVPGVVSTSCGWTFSQLLLFHRKRDNSSVWLSRRSILSSTNHGNK